MPKRLDKPAAVPDPAFIDDENPEWTDADFARARPAADVLPALGIRRRGPQKEPTKESVTIRLSRDVVASFRESGPGWQGRIDAALKDWLKRHRPA